MSEAESASGERSAQPLNSLEEQAIRGLTAAYQKMRQEIGRVIIGQDEVVDQLLIAMFCRAHCLLVGCVWIETSVFHVRSGISGQRAILAVAQQS